LDDSVKKIEYAIWNCQDDVNKKYCETYIKNNETSIECVKINDKFYPAYNIHAYMYDEDNKILDIVVFCIDFGTNYNKDKEKKDIKELTEKENYKILLRDFANNESIYYIKVK